MIIFTAIAVIAAVVLAVAAVVSLITIIRKGRLAQKSFQELIQKRVNKEYQGFTTKTTIKITPNSSLEQTEQQMEQAGQQLDQVMEQLDDQMEQMNQRMNTAFGGVFSTQPKPKPKKPKPKKPDPKPEPEDNRTPEEKIIGHRKLDL